MRVWALLHPNRFRVAFPLLWMLVIFLFSAQSGSESGSLSRWILETALSVIDYTPTPEIFIFLEGIVRKLAHFSIYGVLAFAFLLAIHPQLPRKQTFLIVVTLCFLYACTDEWHQSFVSLRGPSFTDVMIDTSGSIFVSILFLLFFSTACSQNSNSKSTNTKMDIKKTEVSSMTKEDWKQKLSPDQFEILFEKGTERPYTGKYLNHKDDGNYTCAACGAVLFKSQQKFDSHCGWPSFFEQFDEKCITTHTDLSHGMERTEIMCANCGGHLGHVFNDGPGEKGLRYCVNSLSLGFTPDSSATGK